MVEMTRGDWLELTESENQKIRKYHIIIINIDHLHITQNPFSTTPSKTMPELPLAITSH